MIPLIQETDRHITECKRRIDEQRRRIFEQQKRGDDTTASTDLLASLIHFLAIAEMRRETQLRRSALKDNEAKVGFGWGEASTERSAGDPAGQS